MIAVKENYTGQIVEKRKRTVLYPGSFDPLTNGHLDLIVRASRIFDTVYVAVACNHSKAPTFSVEERISLVEQSCAAAGIGDKVRPVAFEGLVVDAIDEFRASAILRGLRAFSDFEYELQMALMNRKLKNQCETLFMMPSQENSFISSRLIKEIALMKGEFAQFVPDVVRDALIKKFNL